MKALIVSAATSGAGKTMITLGLLRALRDRGVAVSAAKSGPDYIDPGFHDAAVGAPSVNLDAWAMRPERLRALAAAQGGGLLLVEGAMGLFDAGADGRGPTADVAAALGAPVVLVMDVARQGQTAAAVAAGLARWRDDVRIAGVISNRVGSPRHRRLVENAMAAAGVTVFGALPRLADLAAPSRHLGLVQARERADIEAFVAQAGRLLAEHVDLDALSDAAGGTRSPSGGVSGLPPLGQRVAIARDDAFAFHYPHLLSDWRAAGSELSFFSPLKNETPEASADAVYLPGGYPELHAGRLAAAARFKDGVRAAAARGGFVYGECGGYMVLGDGLVDADGARHQMIGLLDLETSFAERRLSLGYRTLAAHSAIRSWPKRLTAHEFHYSMALTEQGDALFDAVAAGDDQPKPMGLRKGTVAGSYAHVIDAA